MADDDDDDDDDTRRVCVCVRVSWSLAVLIRSRLAFAESEEEAFVGSVSKARGVYGFSSSLLSARFAGKIRSGRACGDVQPHDSATCYKGREKGRVLKFFGERARERRRCARDPESEMKRDLFGCVRSLDLGVCSKKYDDEKEMFEQCPTLYRFRTGTAI